ncbi:MAG: IPT/TIG domain-containing protein, partial [Myxococcota bacterium]
SDVATNALDTQSVGGLDSAAVGEIFEVWNFDGGPPSTDPSEGLADVDADGNLNFVDSDNDGDTLSDSVEVDAGSDINLVTPSIGTVTPNSGEGDQVTQVTVSGNGFLPGLTAQFGTQLVSVTNLTPSSFDAGVGAHPGPFPVSVDLTVTNANGEVGVQGAVFTFDLTAPSIGTVTPSSGHGDEVTPVTVTGSGFLPGLTAQFGTQAVSVSNLTSTSFEAGVGPNPGPYPVSVDLTVTNANGKMDALDSAFTFVPPSGTTPTPLPFTLAAPTKPVAIVAQGEELLVYGTQKSAQNTYAVDTIMDGTIAFDRVPNLNGLQPSAISWNASKTLYALRGNAPTDQVLLLRDNNGDELFFGADESVAIESPGADPRTRSPGLSFDGSGRPGGGYLRLVGSAATAVAFHDRDGNGTFGGVNEVVTIEAVGDSTDHLGDAVFDPSGRLAYVYGAGGNVRVAYDRSGDGDFDDSPGGVTELATVASGAAACLDASFDGSGRLGVLYVAGSGNPTLLYDRNGDADFADANETQALPGSGTSTGCDLGTSALTGRLVIVHNPGNELRLLVDMNDDGDFADGAEEAALGSPITAPLGVATTSSGVVRVLAPQGVVSGPVR